MLCAIKKCTGLKVVALSVEKADGPYLCPKCRVELNLKKGQIKAHQFLHTSRQSHAHTVRVSLKRTERQN